MKKTTPASWNETLQKTGIKKGETVMLHSHLPAFGYLEGGPQMLIDTLLSYVGSEGTIIMPAFTLSFGNTRVFDHKESPSEMGILTELFRTYPDVLRSSHPFHSVSAWGKHAEEIVSGNCISSFGHGSPFEKIHELDAWLLCAGIGAERLTFVHYVEEREVVPYRGKKEYPGIVRLKGKNDSTTYQMYSRDLRFKMNLKGWTNILLKEGLGETYSLPYGTLYAYRAKEVYSKIAKLLKKNPGALVTVKSPIGLLLEGNITLTV